MQHFLGSAVFQCQQKLTFKVSEVLKMPHRLFRFSQIKALLL